MNSEQALLIANIISTIGALIFICGGLVKNKKTILSFSCAGYISFIISDIFSGLWALLIQDTTSLIRNLTIIFKKNTKALNVIFIVLALTLGIGINILTRPEGTPWYGLWYQYFGVLGNIQFAIITLLFNNEKLIKLSLSISCLLFGLSYLFAGLIPAGIINIFGALLAVCTLITTIFKEKKRISKDCL